MSGKKSLTNRKSCALSENSNRSGKHKYIGGLKKREDIVKLVKNIEESLIGKNTTFNGPFGRRKGLC